MKSDTVMGGSAVNGGTLLASFAHLSDPHLPIQGPLLPRHWAFKRVLGYLNWHRRRKPRFRREVLDRIVADLRTFQFDQILMTGDIANIGLPSELDAGLDWLRQVGAPEDVVAVPGNHDHYVAFAKDPGVLRWGAYLEGDVFGRVLMESIAGEAEGRPSAFPFVRRPAAGVALIALNSSRPMPFYSAQGELGEGQLALLESVLCKLRELGLLRIVLIHHPPLAQLTRPLRALRDADGLADVLRRNGAELVLHGHNHTNTVAHAEGPDGLIPIVGVASAGFLPDGAQGDNLARYNLIRILKQPHGLFAVVTGRGFAAADESIRDLDTTCLELPRAAAAGGVGVTPSPGEVSTS